MVCHHDVEGGSCPAERKASALLGGAHRVQQLATSWWLERVVGEEECSPLLTEALPFSATLRFMLTVLALALVRQAVSRPVPLCSYGTRKLRVCAGGRLKPARPGEEPPVKVIGT